MAISAWTYLTVLIPRQPQTPQHKNSPDLTGRSCSVSRSPHAPYNDSADDPPINSLRLWASCACSPGFTAVLDMAAPIEPASTS
ncbi:hypothetical protein [Hymenobacter aerophilus]|uniref:hypothetical protein n=1 Tax=Hymenobacter aerophilus TaxID=119644 RepID=UPI0012F84C88|nr:hypothetical protein [Hymenobacter aerophilus]